MKMNEMIKSFINSHKSKVELFQWAVISSLSSLIYSEYIKNIRQQQVPTRIIWVPQTRSVSELLEPNSYLSQLISESLIDFIVEKDIFKEYRDIPELIIFNDENDNIEILKTVLDLYILPNVVKTIPSTIRKKFDLDNPDKQLIRESRDIDLFNRIPITDKQFDFIVEQTILQLFVILPSIEKKQELPEDNSCVFLLENEILTVNHENAICPIHFNKSIIENNEVYPLLSFVTNTNIKEHYNTFSVFNNTDQVIFYDVSSNPFNRLMTTQLLGKKVN